MTRGNRLKAGSRVRKIISAGGIESVSESTYTIVRREDAARAYAGAQLYAVEDGDPDAAPSAFPFDPLSGYEIGNPLSNYGCTCRCVIRDGENE